MTAPLPTLPGYVEGIVAELPGAGHRGRTLYTLQCAHCLALETPQIVVLMQTHFHPRSPKDNNPRLCRACRVRAYPDCNCYTCETDRTEQTRSDR